MSKRQKTLIILCGSNGAGKSTFHKLYLKNLNFPFINADNIAKEEFGENAEKKSYEAAEMAAKQRNDLLESGSSFIFETVLSDPKGSKIEFFKYAQKIVYTVSIHFIGISNSSVSKARVMERVATGGHSVPEQKIIDRYPRTLKNLERMIPCINEITIYDNDDALNPYRRIARFQNGVMVSACEELPQWTEQINLHSYKTGSTLLTH